MQFHTIGHSNQSQSSLIFKLQQRDIQVLVDVRHYPRSRTCPHFNSEPLAAALRLKGIGYVSILDLGGRRRVHPDSPHRNWRNASFRGYADYMQTEDFARGIDLLLRLAGKARVAFMCSEAVWWRCHRSMIADYLKSLGHTVIHIMDDMPRHDKEHPYTGAATLRAGQLCYGDTDAPTLYHEQHDSRQLLPIVGRDDGPPDPGRKSPVKPLPDGYWPHG